MGKKMNISKTGIFTIALMTISPIINANELADKTNVFYCMETAATGFVWKNGTVIPDKIIPERFTMHVTEGSYKRKIHDQGGISKTVECVESYASATETNPLLFSCTSFEESFIFQGKNNRNFTRSYIFSKHIGGNKSILVSYGTCVNFGAE